MPAAESTPVESMPAAAFTSAAAAAAAIEEDLPAGSNVAPTLDAANRQQRVQHPLCCTGVAACWCLPQRYSSRKARAP
jgi:hypothetical protein